MDQWGDTGLTSLARAFLGAANLTQIPATSARTGNAIDMTGMFFGASAFDADLSGWCVSQIPDQPDNFDTGADAWVSPRPVWGAACT